jgi:hypothetical protein
MGDEQLLAGLKQKFAEYDAERREAEAVKREAEAVLARVKPLIEHTLALIQDIEAKQGQGIGTNVPASQPQPSANQTAPQLASEMPERCPAYQHTSVVNASLGIVESELRPWHIDDLVMTIFNVYSKQEEGFQKAKKAVSSELSRAAKHRGLLQQLGGHRFASNNFKPQHNNGLPTVAPGMLPSDEAPTLKEIRPEYADGTTEREQHLDGNGGF